MSGRGYVGTLSLNINTTDLNHGAVLHSWAFQQALQKYKLAARSEIVDYDPNDLSRLERKYLFVKPLKGFHPRAFLRTLARGGFHSRRFEKIQAFIDENMIVSSAHYARSTIGNAELPYDTLICESDVIWAPSFFGGQFDPTFFMAFDNMKSMKRIAYAASMADLDFSQEQERSFSRLVRNVDFVSCRESYNADYARRFACNTVAHVVDPTLLLTEEDYICITAPRMVDERYVLMYFPMDHLESTVEAAKKYAAVRNARLVEVSRQPYDSGAHVVFADAGIEEFLSLVKYADAVFCSSLHGVCFSLIFNKEFYAFPREHCRKIMDICESAGLSERFMVDGFEILESIDYGEIDSNLRTKRERSLAWLQYALGQGAAK